MHTFSTELGGRPLTIETGKIAKQANGSVLIRYGETAVVVAVTGTDTPREGVDFFPLTVDFEEKMYAAGKIPARSSAVKAPELRGHPRLPHHRPPAAPLFPHTLRNERAGLETVLAVNLMTLTMSSP